MFFKKSLREADKQIKQDKDFIIDSEGDALISVKAPKKEQIFSSYNYDSNEKLNGELDEFIYDKAKFVPLPQDIKLKIYTEENIDEVEVKKAIKNNYKKQYIEIKNELKKNTLFSLVMFILGILSLSLLLLMHKFFYNVYFEIIIEIATWVFVWEAVDSFFLQKAELKRKRATFLKLYSSEIEIVKLNKIK